MAEFDTEPAAPEQFTSSSEYAAWDVQVHSRDPYTWGASGLDSMMADHGTACQSPDDPTSSQHENHTYDGAVFICKDHLMTSMNAAGYGVIYLTPNRLLDWSNGPATLSFDVSTHKASTRDWWDVWLSPFTSNVALPIEGGLPDLQSSPTDGSALGGAQFLHIDSEGNTTGFMFTNNHGVIKDNRAVSYKADSKSQRDTFVLTIDRNNFSFCKPDENICWAQQMPHDLSITQAVIQIGHHSYNPQKEGAGLPGTWHWDNINLNPSVPFTMIKPDVRSTAGGIVNFSASAPSNSFLHFAAIGKVTVDGKAVSPQIKTTHPEAFNSYMVPVASGTKSVKIALATDSWYTGPFMARDFAIWNAGAASSAPVSPATATPTAKAATPTAKAATATASPTPSTKSATATPSRTATSPTATSTPAKTPTSATATATASGWSSKASVGLATIPRGKTESITASVKSIKATSALIDVEVYAPNGTRVLQKYFDKQAFKAGEERSFSAPWSVPSNAATGTYTVKIGVFIAGWGQLFNWNDRASTFVVN